MNVEIHGDGLDEYGNEEEFTKKNWGLICDRQDSDVDELDLPEGTDDGFSDAKTKWTHRPVKLHKVTVKLNNMQRKMVKQADVEFSAVRENARRVSEFANWVILRIGI